MRARFSRWTGATEPFAADVSAEDVLDAISEDVLSGLSVDQAMARLLRRGMSERAVAGLDELGRRVAQARRRELSGMGLDAPLREAAQRLEQILDRERTALEFDARDGAEDRRALLDSLPPDVGARLAALASYDWTDPQAGAAYAALVADLRRDVAEAAFGRLAGALRSMSPQDVQRVRDMLAELNAMVDKLDRGEEVGEDFARFKQRYGDLLDGDPATLEALLDDLARRRAAMSRLMAGMDDDQREQLAAMADQLLGDLDFAFEASRLEQALRRRHPQLLWGQRLAGTADGQGPAAGELAGAVDWMQHLEQLDELARVLGQDYAGARLEDVSPDALRAALGEDGVRHLDSLRAIERALEEAGAARRGGGRLELTPRGLRRIGERSLARIYGRAIGGRTGAHAARSAGDGELIGSTRPLAFGDPFRLDVPRSVQQAVLRAGAPGRAAHGAAAVKLEASDFQLAEAERRVRVATVLLLDLSFSMPLRGNWMPAKRVALALHALAASRFPEDHFEMVGFSDYARRIQPRELITVGWERVYGTNMQHAFMLARRALEARSFDERHVIMITDGEPTAHLEAGEAFFAWPPERRTLELTMAEAGRLAHAGATLNVFLLDHDPGAATFIETMVSACGGSIFYPDLADLGEFVVRDFLRRR